jgi:hypothetical protein
MNIPPLQRVRLPGSNGCLAISSLYPLQLWAPGFSCRVSDKPVKSIELEEGYGLERFMVEDQGRRKA